MRIVVLVSGSGSNLQAIMDACVSGMITGQVVGVLCNRPDAYALQRAARAGIPSAVINHREYASRAAFDARMQQQIDAWSADVVVLAGFMRILTPGFVQHYAGRLLNIHPSLLPLYKGLHTHRRVLACGDKWHGCSVHFVNAELDGGPVIAQALTAVRPGDDEQTLSERIHQSEHLLYPRVLSWLANGRLRYAGNQPVLDGLPLLQPEKLMFRE